MPPHSKLQSGPLRNHLHFFFLIFILKVELERIDTEIFHKKVHSPNGQNWPSSKVKSQEFHLYLTQGSKDPNIWTIALLLSQVH